MIIDGIERSGTKRRRLKRQKPRSDIANDIVRESLAEGTIKTIGSDQYACKDFTSVRRDPVSGEIVEGFYKYQYVKITPVA